MEWAAVTATALGAIVGVLSSSASDRLRWRRDTSEKDRETLRTIYAEFLDAVTQARNTISHAAHDSNDSLEVRARAARGALTEGGVYEKQYRLELSAPPAVLPLAGNVLAALLGLRDVVRHGARPMDAEYNAAWAKLYDARTALLGAMRSSLQR